MLAEADPRGLPGVQVEHIAFQRAGEGHPLDDVILHGVTRTGEQAVLEVQVKRRITFARTDAVFDGVVKQLAQAFQQLDLSQLRHQLAVATEKTSFKIAGPYQDVLRWAREVGSASTFVERINRPNVGNSDMRNFVATVRSHLEAADCPNDDEAVWQLLRRFHILPFDYDAPGSLWLELAHERARHVLDPQDASRASAFWKVLTETAVSFASSGGDLDRERLRELAGVDGFRLLGSRRNRMPRETLSQVASLAAEELQGSIDRVTLARSAQLAAVREARDRGRYVEIRGGPGVGKSGLLGQLVQHVLAEARAIVLTPQGTPPGGWSAFKSDLGIEDASPKEFLSDLSSDGGAVLFVDGLDFFEGVDKRATVKDLVRAAAAVPSFQVIVTARTDFGKDDPNWLPTGVLAKLGRAPTVVMEELGDEEIEELRMAVPALRALLADNHPARDIARNLLRLSRLLEVQGSTDELRTEVDLLERWWKTADGSEEGRRERMRLLADLSEAALASRDHIDTRATPTAVDALIKSKTLREVSLDRLTFRHDVFRDWGVAARLHDDPSRLDQLPLTRPAPASLARGVEIGARFTLERPDDGQPWISYLDKVSPVGAHASWRRWSLLAILRSELSLTLLDRVAASLFGGEGALLRELIRTALAVESRPLAETLAEQGADVTSIPPSIYGPSNASWERLAWWLLARRADLPVRAIPDVVDLFQSLSISTFLRHPLTPKIAEALAEWLEEIEDAGDRHPLASDQPRFATAFQYQELGKLAEDVRHAFALLASRAPMRAQSYLQEVLKRGNPDYTISDIMRLRGTLAQAAPAELVELTIAGLVPKPENRLHQRSVRDEIFTHLNMDFLPSSPAQGPFLDLLNAAPEQGLGLIRRLVDHAIAALTDGQESGDDGLTLVFPSGPRFFPWRRTYHWSRNADGLYALESGLMALEAWSHVRVERGDPLALVIADILGPEGSPAAFVLVAVDVLISHWPKTATVSIPFLGAPELLSLDRSRQIHDSIPGMDLLGWDAIGPKEPRGRIRLSHLKQRQSRRRALEALLPNFAFGEASEREALKAALEAASAGLGSPEPDDTFADARLMARYALNVIDPTNWHLGDGGPTYVQPRSEAEHLAALQTKRAPRTLDFEIDTAIQNALENSESSSAELAEHAVAYANRLETAADVPVDFLKSRTTSIVSAAMIVARDGDDQLLIEHEQWVRGAFQKAFEASDHDIGSSMRDGIRFNRVAIATLGLIHLWRRRGGLADRASLLEVAGRDTAEAAQGFGAGLEVICQIDRRMVRALLRCALAAQIQPTRDWDDREERKTADQARHRNQVASTIAAECAWLDSDGEEPAWPRFPPRAIHVKRGLWIGGGDDVEESKGSTIPTQEVLRPQSAALWARQLTQRSSPCDLDWLRGFVEAYSEWTTKANGAGFERQAEVDNHVDDWNNVFNRLLVYSLARMKRENAVADVARAIDVPDESLLRIAAGLLRTVDEVYFNGLGLDLETAARLRGMVADRLVGSAGWQWERDRTEPSMETRIGPAIAVLFFNNYVAFGEAQCYLLAKGIDQVAPFLPQLTRLIEVGPVPFTALLTMNLLEVSHKPEHAGFFLSSALTWLRRQPTNTLLWVDHGLGARLAKWLESVTKSETSLRLATHPLRSQMDEMLARLVQVGVPEAHRLERKFEVEHPRDRPS
jgi:hypothetical protein